MKSLDQKRDEQLSIYVTTCYNLYDQYQSVEARGGHHGFISGWDVCAKEYEKENTKLKRQLEIAKETLNKIKSPHFGLCMSSSDEEAREYWFDLASDYREQAEQALNDLESAGE